MKGADGDRLGVRVLLNDFRKPEMIFATLGFFVFKFLLGQVGLLLLVGSILTNFHIVSSSKEIKRKLNILTGLLLL